jgi:mono/diheme cytochrome c family protein
MKRIAIAWVAAAGALLFAADSQVSERGKQEEQHSCIQCHSPRLVNAQRLSRAAWGKEIDKMMGWGAPVRDRDLLLNYLSEEYPDSKPVPKPDLTRNGVASGSKH